MMTERRPHNSSADRCAIILTRCISIFTRHTFRTYKTFKCTAIPISVGSAARVCLKKPYDLNRHERTCTGGVRRVYPGGVYHSTPSVFEGLDDENIRVPE